MARSLVNRFYVITKGDRRAIDRRARRRGSRTRTSATEARRIDGGRNGAGEIVHCDFQTTSAGNHPGTLKLRTNVLDCKVKAHRLSRRSDCAEGRKTGPRPNQSRPLSFQPPKKNPAKGRERATQAVQDAATAWTILRSGLCPLSRLTDPSPERSERAGIAGSGQAATPATGQARDARPIVRAERMGGRFPPCTIGELGRERRDVSASRERPASRQQSRQPSGPERRREASPRRNN